MNNLVPTPKPPFWLLAAANVFQTFGARIVKIWTDAKVEGAEIVCIVLCGVWYVPLSLYDNYLRMAPPLRSVEAILPRPVLLACVTTIGLFMVVGVIAGGSPSAFIKTNANAVFWLCWRQYGLRVAGFLFAVLAILMSAKIWTVGAGIYLLLGVGAAGFGVMRFKLLIKKAQVAHEFYQEEQTLAQAKRECASL